MYQAFLLAIKGKAAQEAGWVFRLESELLSLQRELLSGSYDPGKFANFFVCDPKKRLISAAPFRDRVVHHALCRISQPFFERSFINDSYANRKGKGSHRAIERFQKFSKLHTYVLKCDIQGFFQNIDHLVLKSQIRKIISCTSTLQLIDVIIDHYESPKDELQYFSGDNLFTPVERRSGLPIGNLTSQIWGNLYLNDFDHFVKEQLRCKAYIRYVDDFVLFSNCKKELWLWLNELHSYLGGLRMMLHKNKTQIHTCSQAVPFLGFKILGLPI